jgi:protein-tyrosine-phosphatase
LRVIVKNTDSPVRVLFLCTGNSARSIIAEKLLEHLGNGRFQSFSAGSQPTGRINPLAVEALKKHGCPTDGLRSKSWDEFAGADAEKIDIVITVCDSAAAEACPVWPGHPLTTHWGVPDPAAVTGDAPTRAVAFDVALTRLARRIDAFVRLPIAEMEPAVLKAKLDAIGGLSGSAKDGG